MNPDKPDVTDPWITSADDWPLDLLLELKGATRIAVVIPARNEERTIGGVVRSILDELDVLADEVVVMDSLSSDSTARVAAAAGARVYSMSEVRPDLGIRAGKGEALWKSQFVTNTDVTAFIDADLTEWGPHFLRGVIGPLLADPQVQLCRGFYDRLLDVGGLVTLEGGRVTELVARPWLALFRPGLSGMVQPLAGEWAIRGTMLRSLSIPTGYGVEISTLLDVHARYGIRAIAQVDLGRRAHRHQNIHDLGAMAVEVLAAANRRRFPSGVTEVPHSAVLEDEEVSPHEVLLRSMGEDRQWAVRTIMTDERPPLDTVN
ncbi:MAG: glucosyl-3-phosphoglycerate synthase [Candidatus Nanopelagicales bacterium]|nr:glucosyl-3-phosphoglycerate synthase [Candidatus Nanopelagicales bacterium]